MALYEKQTWVDKNDLYSVTASRLGHIEDGIFDVSALVYAGLDSSKIADNAITTPKINALAVTTAKIADASVTQAKLASPTHGVYRTLFHASGVFPLDAVAATYILRDITVPNASPYNLLAATAAPSAIYLDADDYTVAGLVPKLRVRGQIWTNGTQPAINFTFGLHSASTSGAADVLTLTAGAALGSSTAVVASPAINAATNASSADFDVPADGIYLPVCVTSATITNNAAVGWSYQLQLHHV